MLRTKCILAPPSAEDGARISVMSRHTLNDGITPDERITPDLYDIWCKNLAPPDRVVGRYYRGDITFVKYKELYIIHLRRQPQVKTLWAIAKYSLHETITFLCIEESPEWCHRTVLLHECWGYDARLKIKNL